MHVFRRNFGRRWIAAVLFVSLAVAALPAATGCGDKAMSQDEAREYIESAYQMMAEAPSYRFRSEVKYEFPELSDADKATVASRFPSYLSLEGETTQQDGDYSQHSVSKGMAETTENYIVDNLSYQYTKSGGWTVTDLASQRLNLSSMYFFSHEDFEKMMGFVGEINVIEDSPERVILSFDAGNEYLVSSLEKKKDLYQTEEELAVYNSLLQLMQGSTATITSTIYRSSGHLQKQETVMNMPNTPMIGLVVMSFTTEFYDYGADIQIVLPEEAKKAKPVSGL